MDTRDYLVKALNEEVGLLHGAYHDGTNSLIWKRFSTRNERNFKYGLRVVVSTALAELDLLEDFRSIPLSPETQSTKRKN